MKVGVGTTRVGTGVGSFKVGVAVGEGVIVVCWSTGVGEGTRVGRGAKLPQARLAKASINNGTTPGHHLGLAPIRGC